MKPRTFKEFSIFTDENFIFLFVVFSVFSAVILFQDVLAGTILASILALSLFFTYLYLRNLYKEYTLFLIKSHDNDIILNINRCYTLIKYRKYDKRKLMAEYSIILEDISKIFKSINTHEDYFFKKYHKIDISNEKVINDIKFIKELKEKYYNDFRDLNTKVLGCFNFIKG
jgi:hypothetical protein